MTIARLIRAWGNEFAKDRGPMSSWFLGNILIMKESVLDFGKATPITLTCVVD
jgi:hypothetical protein